MEKIVIELTGNRLAAVNAAFGYMVWPVMTRSMRHSKSILSEVAAKLMKKAIDKPPDTGTFKMKLKYHEADVLEQFLRAVPQVDEDHYSATLRAIVRDELHQKLQ